MYGFTPINAKASLNNYRLYFSFPGEIQFSDISSSQLSSYVKISSYKDIKHLAFVFTIQFISLGLLYSVLEPMDYLVFGGNLSFCDEDECFFDKLLNNFIVTGEDILHSCGLCIYLLFIAVHTYLCLTVGTVGVCLVTQLVFGIQTINVTNNPIFQSKSPSDFWSKRWNILVHGVLKVSLFI